MTRVVLLHRRCLLGLRFVLCGFNGPIKLSRDRLISLGDFLNSNPFLTDVPSDRLITRFEPTRPHILPCSTRTFVRSGIIPLYICEKQGISIPDAFCEDNVGVIDGLGLIAFKELKVEEAQEGDDMPGKFHAFLKDLICKHHGPATLNKLPVGFEALMRSLDATGQTTQKVHIDEQQVYHPALFSNDLLATIYFDGHRFLRHELPALGTKEKAIAIQIMTDIDKEYPYALNDIMKDDILKIWIGAHHPNARSSANKAQNQQNNNTGQNKLNATAPKKCNRNQVKNKHSSSKVQNKHKNAFHQLNASNSSQGQKKHNSSKGHNKRKNLNHQPNAGNSNKFNNSKSQQQSGKMVVGMHQVGKPSPISAGDTMNLAPKPAPDPKNPKQALLFDIHRHPVAHGFDKANVKAVKKNLPVANQNSMRAKPYTIRDIVDLLVHKFPLYPLLLIKEFWKANFWDKLNLKTRFPIPSIYHA